MKKILASTALIAMIASGAAYADGTSNTTVQVNGTAQEVANVGGTGAPITWNPLISNTDATVLTLTNTQNFANALINYNGYLAIKSANGGMTSATANPADGFITRVDYTATATWGSLTSATFTTDGTAYSDTPTDGTNRSNVATGGAVAGNLQLVINTSATTGGNSSSPVVAASDYTDTVTLQVGAAF